MRDSVTQCSWASGPSSLGKSLNSALTNGELVMGDNCPLKLAVKMLIRRLFIEFSQNMSKNYYYCKQTQSNTF